MDQILFLLYRHCPKNYTFDNSFIKKKSTVCARWFDRLLRRDHIVRVGVWVQPCRGIFRNHGDGGVALAIAEQRVIKGIVSTSIYTISILKIQKSDHFCGVVSIRRTNSLDVLSRVKCTRTL